MYFHIHQFVSGLIKRPFVRNLTVMMTGAILAQLITLAFLPVVSRLYSPTQFGVFGAFTSLLGIFSAAANLQYSQALILPKRDKEAFSLLIAALSVAFIMAILFALFAFFCSRFLQSLFKASNVYWLLWIFPVIILVTSVGQILQCWCIRTKQFRKIAANQIVRAGIVSLTQLLVGISRLAPAGLITGLFAGETVATILLASTRSVRPFSQRLPRFQHILAAMRRYRDFPLFSTPLAVVAGMSVGLPVLLLTHFFGLAVTGAFSIALRLLQAPINFILAPLRQVLFQKATELHNHSGDIRKLYNLSTSYLFAICIIPTVLLFCFAPPIFSLILGDQWRVAGEYGRWMSLWLLSSVCKLPSDLLGRILRKQGIMLILEVATLVVRVFTIIAGSVWLTASGTVAAFSVISCATNITLIVVVARAVKKHNPLSVNT